MRKERLAHLLPQFVLELSGVGPSDIQQETARLRVTARDSNEKLHTI